MLEYPALISNMTGIFLRDIYIYSKCWNAIKSKQIIIFSWKIDKLDEMKTIFIVNCISGTSLIMACCNDCVDSVRYERCAQFDDDCRDLVRGISQGCPTVFSQRIMKNPHG